MDWSAVIVGLLAVIGSYLGNVALTNKKAREDALHDKEHHEGQQKEADYVGYYDHFG